MIQLTIKQIKSAINAGKEVFHLSNCEQVIKDKHGEFLIKNLYGPEHCIGLHGKAGTKYANRMNGSGFYIAD